MEEEEEEGEEGVIEYLAEEEFEESDLSDIEVCITLLSHDIFCLYRNS